MTQPFRTEPQQLKVGDKIRILEDKPSKAGLESGDICQVMNATPYEIRVRKIGEIIDWFLGTDNFGTSFELLTEPITALLPSRNDVALQLLLRIIPNYLKGPMNIDDMANAVEDAFELADLFLKKC